MAAIIGIGVLVAILVDYLFSATAAAAIHNEDSLTSFFGLWYSNISVISLLVQVLITGRLLRRLGVGRSLFVLPAGIIIGAVSILVFPGLVTAIVIRIFEGGLKHSVNKAGIELLTLAIPSSIKKQAKSFIDIFITNISTGVGGIMLLLMVSVLGMSLPQISLTIIAFTIIWIAMVVMIREEYVNAFRTAIERRTIDIHDPTLNLNDPAVFQGIKYILEGKNQRQILYVLRLIEDFSSEEFAPILENLVDHPSTEVKKQVLNIIGEMETLDLSKKVRLLVDDDDEDVRIRAIRYLTVSGRGDSVPLHDFIGSDDYRVRTAATLCAAREYRTNPAFSEKHNIADLYHMVYTHDNEHDSNNQNSEFYRLRAARFIGEARSDELQPYLLDLVNDESLEVRHAAIDSSGKTFNRVIIPKLIDLLGNRSDRRPSRMALVLYGEDIIDDLATSFNSGTLSRRIRLEIIKVLTLLQTPQAVEVLTDNLDDEPAIYSAIIKALNKMRMEDSALKFPFVQIRSTIFKEMRLYIRLKTVLSQHNESSVRDSANAKSDDSSGLMAANRLVEQALQERLQGTLERLFLLLGLIYPIEDINNAFRSIISEKTNLQLDAIEFLDNLVETPLRRQLIPLLEEYSSGESESIANGKRVNRTSGDDYIKVLLEGSDIWLKSCA